MPATITLPALAGLMFLASAILLAMAYHAWKGRKEEKGKDVVDVDLGSDQAEPEDEGEPAVSAATAKMAETHPAPSAPVGGPARPVGPAPASVGVPAVAGGPGIPSAVPPKSVEEAAPPPPPAPGARQTLEVAVLLREEVSGKLIVKVGDREYRSAEELLASKDRRRIEYTLDDLNAWFGATARETPRPRLKEESAKAEQPTRPLSMVEEINRILDRKLIETLGVNRGVRLAEGAGGTVRVYVGVDGYSSVDEVPDPEIRRFIREAVAEWEATR
jgi:hypothetical protein